MAQFVHNWYLITQDRWVLQTITGYQLELMQVPYQIRPSPAIQCSSEEKHKISQEVQELLEKGAIVEAQLTQGSFVSQIFLVEKKEGGLRPVVNLKNLNCFIKTEHFKMEGLHTLPYLIQSQDWMIKMDLKDAYLQIPVCQEHQHLLQFQWNATIYQFKCLPFGLTSAPRVFTKVLKPVVGTLRQMGIRLIVYLDDILIMHQSKEELMQLTPLICQFFAGLGWVVNLKKSHLTPEQSMEFLGFMVNSLTMKLILPAQKLKKIQQDAQRLLKLERVSVRELARFLGKASAASRAVWQAPLHYRARPPENGECSDTREPITARLDTKVQCASRIDQRGNGGSKLVGLLRQHHDRIPFASPDTSIDDRIRCIQHRLGRSSGGSVYGRCMVHRGGNAPYKLPGTASSLPSGSMFCKRATSSNNSVEAGQCDSHDIYQQNGRDTLRTAVSTSPLPLAMVPREGDIFGCCAPTRPRECSSRPRVQSNEGSVRLDARSHSIQTNSGSDGPLRGGFVCIPSDQTTASVLQLEARSGGRRGGCIQSGLVSSKGFCQSTMVPDLSMSSSGEEATSQGSVNHPSMEHSTMVPSSTGAVRGSSPPATESGESCEMSINTGLHNETRGSNSDCMAHLRESFASRGLSSEATGLLLSSWRQKTKCSYNSAFSKWVYWCKQRDRDPTSGPLEDVINFLAELFGQGYQYRSLNSYRSAISAVHAKIDGHAIGQHPLVVRMLKGVFNERSPMARYSAVWDVGVVLRHLKHLAIGNNESLSLRSLTLKTVMLLALTRPARSVDLSNLDILFRSFTRDGVTSKAQHLAKQARPSRPLADYFYPKYSQDLDICPVTTLQVYEARTLEFRDMSSDIPKTSLFLSWIGKHLPVSSSSIARWLKTCLSESGIDTSIFKAHSVRSASSSKAAASGITTADILQAADWSSESTFEKFYHRPTQDKSSYAKAVLSSAEASNLPC